MFYAEVPTTISTALDASTGRLCGQHKETHPRHSLCRMWIAAATARSLAFLQSPNFRKCKNACARVVPRTFHTQRPLYRCQANTTPAHQGGHYVTRQILLCIDTIWHELHYRSLIQFTASDLILDNSLQLMHIFLPPIKPRHRVFRNINADLQVSRWSRSSLPDRCDHDPQILSGLSVLWTDFSRISPATSTKDWWWKVFSIYIYCGVGTDQACMNIMEVYNMCCFCHWKQTLARLVASHWRALHRRIFCRRFVSSTRMVDWTPENVKAASPSGYRYIYPGVSPFFSYV